MGRKCLFSDEMLCAAIATINSLVVLKVPVVKTYFIYEKINDTTKLEAIFFHRKHSSIFLTMKTRPIA